MLNVVITGANRGIGLEFVNQYLQQGANVYALCRNSSDELNKTNAHVIDKVDVGDLECLEKALLPLKDVKIDLLINNAGVLADESLLNMNMHTIEHQFRVNAMGPLLVTQLLYKNINSGGKVALITSRMGSVEDNTSGGRYGYRMSKSALNIAGKSLSIDLKPHNIAVALLHPGYVQTEMVNYGGEISPQISVRRLIARIDGLNLENTGTFWHSNGEVLPW